jgi:surfeit locus 1 family protein
MDVNMGSGATKFQFDVKFTVLFGVIIAILLSLSLWQVMRLKEKETMLATIEMQMKQKPVSLPPQPESAAPYQYRRVIAAGELLNNRVFKLGPRTLGGEVGFHAIVPLQRRYDIVLVDRGFYTEEKFAAFPKENRKAVVNGLLTVPIRGAFTPDNNPSKGEWYWIDRDAIEKALGLEAVAPALLMEGARRPQVRNHHRQYATFWFVMALVAATIFVLKSRRKDDNGKL